MGINDNILFDSRRNSLEWPVREASWVADKIPISEALYHSNNNAFINAANHVGMSQTLNYLSQILHVDSGEIYPAAILGATGQGISLSELVLLYDSYFRRSSLNSHKIECLDILSKIFSQKIFHSAGDLFLKTGTTNNNKERLAVVRRRKQRDMTFGFLLSPSDFDNHDKDSGISGMIRKFLNKLNQKNSSWL